MKVLLLQLDGKLPNISLIRIAAHYRLYADDIAFQHYPTAKAEEASDWWDKEGKPIACPDYLPRFRLSREEY